MDENQSLEQDAMQQPMQEMSQEKTLTQSQVNAIVQREKERAADKARREAEEVYKQQLAQAGQQTQQTEKSGGLEVNADQIYQQVQQRFMQEMQQRQQETEMSNVANRYLQQMQAGKDSYEDFEQVTGDFDPTEFPQLIYLVAGLDNAADVIYDLSKNPSKLATMDLLASRAPKKAQAELLKLATSIKDNRQAASEAEQQGVNAPLDRLQPSRVGTGNGKLGIGDLRNQPWLRG